MSEQWTVVRFPVDSERAWEAVYRLVDNLCGPECPECHPTPEEAAQEDWGASETEPEPDVPVLTVVPMLPVRRRRGGGR